MPSASTAFTAAIAPSAGSGIPRIFLMSMGIGNSWEAHVKDWQQQSKKKSFRLEPQ